MREEIDAGLGVRCVSIFGLSEVIGPCVSRETRVQPGEALRPDGGRIQRVRDLR